MASGCGVHLIELEIRRWLSAHSVASIRLLGRTSRATRERVSLDLAKLQRPPRPCRPFRCTIIRQVKLASPSNKTCRRNQGGPLTAEPDKWKTISFDAGGTQLTGKAHRRGPRMGSRSIPWLQPPVSSVLRAHGRRGPASAPFALSSLGHRAGGATHEVRYPLVHGFLETTSG
jgi:hypothetical protein